MKLCINCKYYSKGSDSIWDLSPGHICRYDGDILNVVTGEIWKSEVRRFDCFESRSFERLCGFEGKWFK
jgi:hypothetical protein